MSAAEYEVLSNVPEIRQHVIRVLGGTNAVSVAAGGKGMTLAYVSAGRFTLTFSNTYDPGDFIGAVCTFSADTPADVKSYVAVVESYASRVVEVFMYESGTLTNLAALEYVTVVLYFSETKGLF